MKRIEFMEALDITKVIIPDKILGKLETQCYNPETGLLWKYKRNDWWQLLKHLKEEHFFLKVFIIREIYSHNIYKSCDELFEKIKEVEL